MLVTGVSSAQPGSASRSGDRVVALDALADDELAETYASICAKVAGGRRDENGCSTPTGKWASTPPTTEAAEVMACNAVCDGAAEGIGAFIENANRSGRVKCTPPASC